ncbi:MAG: phosphate ABC transporter permease family protein, partial [Pseudomonadota bacterium]
MSALLTTPTVLIIALILAIVGFFLGRNRALSAVSGDQRALHSRPKQHGWHVALATFVPAFVLLIVWAFLSGLFANMYTEAIIPEDEPSVQLPASQRAGLTEREIEIREEVRLGLLITNVKALAVAIDGYIDGGSATEEEVAGWNADFAPLQERLQADGQYVASQVSRSMLRYAHDLRNFRNTMGWAGPLVALILAVGGFVVSLLLINKEFRARAATEGWTRAFLVFASTMAILTTIGILAALVLPSLTFFTEYGFFNFLFGLEWAPAADVAGVPEGDNGEYESALGFLPLIWGTLYIALVALLVAVPLGLFAAIYLSEFASKRFRA